MIYKVIITNTAKEDLKEIALYIAKTTKDINFSKNFIIALKNKCISLETNPQRGSYPKDYTLRNSGFRFIAYNDYFVFYEIDEDNHIVYVLAVFNSKRDYMRIIRKFI